MKVSSSVLSDLSKATAAEPGYDTLLEVPSVLLPTIPLRQRPTLSTGTIGATYLDSFINDASFANTNVAAASQITEVVGPGLWHLSWRVGFFRNFLGTDPDRFTWALSHDSGANFVVLCRSNNLAAGAEVFNQGELDLLVTTPSLQFILFLPTCVGAGNRVKADCFLYGARLA